AAIYEEVVAEHREREPAPAGEEGRAAASYLRWLDPHLQARSSLPERTRLAAEVEALRRDLTALQESATQARSSLAERTRLAAEVETLRRDLAALQGTATWRLRERLVRTPLLRLYRALKR